MVKSLIIPENPILQNMKYNEIIGFHNKLILTNATLNTMRVHSSYTRRVTDDEGLYLLACSHHHVVPVLPSLKAVPTSPIMTDAYSVWDKK